jgi:hypothetical protein
MPFNDFFINHLHTPTKYFQKKSHPPIISMLFIFSKLIDSSINLRLKKISFSLYNFYYLSMGCGSSIADKAIGLDGHDHVKQYVI